VIQVPVQAQVQEPPAAYGTFIPTIKSELKPDQLPAWDGDYDTAINYFWKIQQLVALGGYLPEALGYWLWTNLKEGSAVQMWFAMLGPTQQSYMRAHYLHYLQGLKEGFLGRVWQLKMNNAYENQSFCQAGHEMESPTKFIVRQIMHTWLPVNSDDGGPLEVYLVMLRAPISWGPVINIDSIRSVADLYSKITEHKKALVYASRMESSHPVMSDNLLYNLWRVGILPSSTNMSRRQDLPIHRANLGEALEPPAELSDMNNSPSADVSCQNTSSNDDVILKEAYQTLKKRQRAPPKGGYPFPRNDNVMTKLG